MRCEMGAWGYGAFDNDTALDFVPEIINFDIIQAKINNENFYYDEARVATEILIHLDKLGGIWAEQKTIDLLIIVLKGLLEDKEWFGTWNSKKNTAGIKKEVKGYIKALKKIKGY